MNNRAGSDVPWLTYGQIRQIAESFLGQHHPSGEIPVPIEKIVESIGIDIVPIPGLRKAIDSDGFITHDCRAIHVDEDVYDRMYNRYRFTLAHELGHQRLHREVYSQHFFQKIEQWKDFVKHLPNDVYSRMETQANNFAGLVLVPEAQLMRVAKPHVASLSADQRSRGLGIDDLRSIVAGTIAPQFEVASVTAEIRLKKSKVLEGLL